MGCVVTRCTKTDSERDQIYFEYSNKNEEGEKMIHEFNNFLKSKNLSYTPVFNIKTNMHYNIIIKCSTSRKSIIIFDGNNFNEKNFEPLYKIIHAVKQQDD